MSATRPSRSGTDPPTAELRPVDQGAYEGPADLAMLRARRRAARRRSRLARLDVAIGVLVAIVLLVVSPGLAMTAVIAIGLLVACLVWVVLERGLAKRRARSEIARDERWQARG